MSVGNFSNALADFYSSRDIDRGNKRVDFGLNHRSSRGDLEDVLLDTDFYNTKLNASYNQKERDLNWRADIGFQHQKYNWYGLPEGIFDAPTINAIDEAQNYFGLEAGAQLQMEESFFTGGEVLYRRFWDAVKSGENRVVFMPAFEFPVGDEIFGIKLKVDYVNGDFKNAPVNLPTNDTDIKYSNLQVGINPSLTMLRDDLSLNLGVNLVYGLDGERSDSNFYIYPAVTASYRLLDEFAIAYAGIEGELRQNSYYDFVEGNPYVSPTLDIQPTDKQYDGNLGLRGQLIPNLSYNIKGSYKAENRRPLFLLNPQNTLRTDEKGYYYGNSFYVFYDDIRTLGIFGELNVDVNRNFTLGVNAEFYSYNTETDNAAWNLPEVTGSLFMDYQIGEKWYMGANLFYVGERQDVATIATPSGIPSEFDATILTLDSFFDANAHVGHRLSDQLSIFVKAANIANNNYERWANYPVQGLQILGGATYKFDF